MKIGDVVRYKYEYEYADKTTEDRESHAVIVGFGDGSVLVRDTHPGKLSICIEEIGLEEIVVHFSLSGDNA